MLDWIPTPSLFFAQNREAKNLSKVAWAFEEKNCQITLGLVYATSKH